MTRTVTGEQVAGLTRDGVVVLRDVLTADPVATLAAGVERNLADRGPFGMNATRPSRSSTACSRPARRWSIRCSPCAGAPERSTFAPERSASRRRRFSPRTRAIRPVGLRVARRCIDPPGYGLLPRPARRRGGDVDVTLAPASAARLSALFADWPPRERRRAAAQLGVLLGTTEDGTVRLRRRRHSLLIEELSTGARVELAVPVGL